MTTITVPTTETLRTSPRNIQREFQGLPITIEYKKGDRKPSKSLIQGSYSGWVQYADYGYVNGTSSNEEGEGLDVYIGPSEDSERAFLVPLMKPGDPETFMEYKLLLGFDSAKDAKDFCCYQYCEGMVGNLLEVSIDDIKDWADIQAPMADKLERMEADDSEQEDDMDEDDEEDRDLIVVQEPPPQGPVLTISDMEMDE